MPSSAAKVVEAKKVPVAKQATEEKEATTAVGKEGEKKEQEPAAVQVTGGEKEKEGRSSTAQAVDTAAPENKETATTVEEGEQSQTLKEERKMSGSPVASDGEGEGEAKVAEQRTSEGEAKEDEVKHASEIVKEKIEEAEEIPDEA